MEESGCCESGRPGKVCKRLIAEGQSTRVKKNTERDRPRERTRVDSQSPNSCSADHSTPLIKHRQRHPSGAHVVAGIRRAVRARNFFQLLRNVGPSIASGVMKSNKRKCASPPTPRRNHTTMLPELNSPQTTRGPWSLVLGPWSLVLGPWSLVLGPWSLVPWFLGSLVHWSLVPSDEPIQEKLVKEVVDSEVFFL